MALSGHSDSDPRLPDELVDAAITMASGDALVRELGELAIRLRRAAQHSEQRGIYGLADALNRAASSAESWGQSLREEGTPDGAS